MTGRERERDYDLKRGDMGMNINIYMCVCTLICRWREIYEESEERESLWSR